MDEGSTDAGAGFLERKGQVFQASYLPQAEGQRGPYPSRGPRFRDGKTPGTRLGPGIRCPASREAVIAKTVSLLLGAGPGVYFDLSPCRLESGVYPAVSHGRP